VNRRSLSWLNSEERAVIDLNFTDERILATLSPANLKTKEDGSIFQKNGPRLRLYLDAFLLQAAGFCIGSSGLSLSPILRSGKREVRIPGSALRFDMPRFRRVKCWFQIDTVKNTLTVAIPFGSEGC